MSKVSVVIPIYNAEETLEKCIDSIVKQTLPDIEIILVNDGSIDKSKEICERFKQEDNRIKVINKTNEGVGFARNTGIENASGKYIYFCDPDDWLEKDLLEKNINLIEKYNTDIIVFGFITETFKDNVLITKEITKYKFEYITKKHDINNRIEDWCFNNRCLVDVVWNKIYKREFIVNNKLSFSKLRMSQDSEFNIKVFGLIDSILINTDVYYHYWRPDKETAVTRFLPERFEIVKKIFDEYILLYEKSEVIDYSLLYEKYFYWTCDAIERLYKKNSPLTLKEQVFQTKEILNYKYTKQWIKKIKYPDKIFYKLVKFGMEINNVYYILCIYKMKKIIKNII